MKPIKIPAIIGKIGNTIYYCTNLTFGQICDMVKPVDQELHTATSLKDQLQRSLTNNYIKIKEYILDKNDHFFDSLVLAVYDGDPQFTEVRFEIDDEKYSNVGILEFNGEEKIFPVDGQHRVMGIKAAVAEKKELSKETISVMLIGHKNTKEGRERSRRIFSTLNRYVKPVRLGDIIALDEDDVVAIVTRDLLETFPLFQKDRIKAINNKAIPTSDKRAFTSLMTLYECHRTLYKSFLVHKNNKKYSNTQIADSLKSRPSDDIISEFEQYLVDFWNSMITTYNEIESYMNDNSITAAAELRSTETGGNLFFRPIGLLPFVQAISRLIEQRNLSIEDAVSSYANLNRQINTPLWNDILWNERTHRMIMRNQTLVFYMLVEMTDNTILTTKEKEKMVMKYATIFQISSQEAKDRIQSFSLT